MKRHVGKVVRGSKGYVADKRYKYRAIPKNVLRRTVGISVDGSNIDVYKIGEGKKQILITAGIHGNEVGSLKLAQEILYWLHTSTLKGEDYTFYIIPCVNPDGFDEALDRPGYFSSGKAGRFNANGVDLNRNFDTQSFESNAKWNYGKDYAQSRDVFAGKKPFSEPETSTLRDFIKQQKIKVWMSLHNAGSDVASSKDPLAQKLAQTFADESGYKLYSEADWQKFEQTGTAKEWCDKQKISYLEIEGSARWSSDWPELKPAIEKTLRSI